MTPQIPIGRIIEILRSVFLVPESQLKHLFTSPTQEVFDARWEVFKKELKKQYIRRIQDLHPDRHPERAEEAKVLNNAWSAIDNAEIKRLVRAPQRPQRVVRVVMRAQPGFGFWGGATASGTSPTTESWSYGSRNVYVKI